MSTPARLESTTVRLQPKFPDGPGRVAHNQPVRHYTPRHAKPETVTPADWVTPQPTVTAVGDTTTRLPVGELRARLGMPLPQRQPGVALAAELTAAPVPEVAPALEPTHPPVPAPPSWVERMLQVGRGLMAGRGAR